MTEHKARFDLGRDETEMMPADDKANHESTSVPDVVVTGQDGLSKPEAMKEKAMEPEKGASSYPPRSSDSTPRSNSNSEPEPSKEAKKPRWKLQTMWLPPFFEFARPALTWKGFRPVLRASIGAWIGLLLLIIPASERTLGQAAFLTLIVATINPAAYPTTFMIDCAIQQVLSVGLAWAWSVIAIAIAHAARTQYKYTQSDFGKIAGQPYATSGQSPAQIQSLVQRDIFSGAFLEPSSSVVCAIFLAAGGGFGLWMRSYLGPGPHLFAIIFAIILLCITLTIAPLFPYPFYNVGYIFFLPFICQTAVNLVVTFLILPETSTHQFADRLVNTLRPLNEVVKTQHDMLAANPRSQDWLRFKSIRGQIDKAMASLATMAVTEANLAHEISWSRVSGKDMSRILAATRTLASRTTGFNFFYELVEKHLHRDSSESKGGPLADELVIHLAHDDHPTPPESRPTSLHSSPADSDDEPSDSHDHTAAHQRHKARSPLATPNNEPANGHLPSSSRNSSTTSLHDLDEQHGQSHSKVPGKKKHHKRRTKYGRSHGSHINLPPLLQEVLHPHLQIKPVGVMESQKYMDLEDYLGNKQAPPFYSPLLSTLTNEHRRDEAHLEEILQLLSTASKGLLDTLIDGLDHLMDTIHTLKALDRSWRNLVRSDPQEHEERVVRTRRVIEQVEASLEQFRHSDRLDVLRPYTALFDPLHAQRLEHELDSPSHRGLFWSLLYQWVLIGWAEALLKILRDTAAIEKKRTRTRLWWPDWARARFHGRRIESAAFEDESPDTIPGLDSRSLSAPRDPDSRPPSTRLQLIGVKLYKVGNVLSGKDFLFGVKAAVLIGLVSMPAYLRSSAFFFYRERGIWVVIMAALTLNQYVGDTTFNFIIRIGGTFVGAIVGMVIWYIGAGNGHGNYYGMAAICAFAFPFIMIYRIYQQPPVSAILPAVTTMLVLGYSWQNANQPTLSAIGFGFAVAWRRFVAVMIGITVAFIWSFLPPKATQKETVRKTYANVTKQLGTSLCQVVSYANCKKDKMPPPKVIVKNISALRAKVQRTALGIGFIKYEVSLRGPWPTKNYLSIKNLLLELLDLVGQLVGVLASLNGIWVRAVIQRTQLANPGFLADMLNALHMVSTALAQGQPLPMIYNPLLERFLKPREVELAGHGYGFEVSLTPSASRQDLRHPAAAESDHANDSRDEHELPEHVDWNTIKKEEYLLFSTACSLVYALVNRIDRLVVVAKSVVGESYVIYGLPVTSSRERSRKGKGGIEDEQERMEQEALLFAPDSTRPSFEDSPDADRAHM